MDRQYAEDACGLRGAGQSGPNIDDATKPGVLEPIQSGRPNRQDCDGTTGSGGQWCVLGKTGANGRTHWVEFEGRVLARENIEVPAGTFDTFKVQIDFVLEDGLRRRATFWSQPEWGIPLRMIVETHERRAVAPSILIRDIVARRRA